MSSSLTLLASWCWLLASCPFPSWWSSPQGLLSILMTWWLASFPRDKYLNRSKLKPNVFYDSLGSYTSSVLPYSIGHTGQQWFSVERVYTKAWIQVSKDHWKSSEAGCHCRMKQTKIYTSESLYLKILGTRWVFYITFYSASFFEFYKNLLKSVKHI